MRCPKCEEGDLLIVRFKGRGNKAYLCEFCGTFWPEGEEVSAFSGHSVSSLGQEKEYTLSVNEGDPEDQPVKFPKVK